MLDCLPDQPLCIPTAYAEVTGSTGFIGIDGREALASAFARRGVKIERVFTDMPEPPDAWRLEPKGSRDRVCRAGVCVSYTLHCRYTLSTCDLAFRPTAVKPGELPLREATEWYALRADDADHLERLLADVSLRVGRARVQLSALNVSCGVTALAPGRRRCPDGRPVP